MTLVVLDGAEMLSRQKVHEYLAGKFGLPENYGGNLDALWDILSTVSSPLHVRLTNADMLALNSYGVKLIQVFKDAADFNPNFVFQVFDQQN